MTRRSLAIDVLPSPRANRALWPDTRNNPLTVIVAKDGYQPTVATVKIKKGAAVLTDFTLKRK